MRTREWICTTRYSIGWGERGEKRDMCVLFASPIDVRERDVVGVCIIKKDHRDGREVIQRWGEEKEER